MFEKYRHEILDSEHPFNVSSSLSSLSAAFLPLMLFGGRDYCNCLSIFSAVNFFYRDYIPYRVNAFADALICTTFLSEFDFVCRQ